MSVSIRKLDEDDWLMLKDMRLKALKSDPGVFGSNYEKEAAMSDDQWREWLVDPDNACFGVFVGGGMIGMTGIAVSRDDPTRKTAILWGSWLEPKYRNKGLSKLMYGARIDWAKARPRIQRIVVSHRASNEGSKRANQKHGFILTKVSSKTWPDGGVEDELFYELKLKR